MSSVLNIFLSYKMPKSEEGDQEKVDIANDFADVFDVYSAGKLDMHYAGRFAAGTDWRDELIHTIKKCDIFILLCIGPEQQWEFCLLEAGLFQATHPDRPLVVLHDPAVARPPALAQLQSVKMTVPDLTYFLLPIFHDESWIINQKLSHGKIIEIAADLVHKFHSDSKNGMNFDLVPNFTLEMASAESNRTLLRSGRLPDTSKIRGTQDWQVLFDKGVANQILKWSDLSTWPVKQFYELKFARMAYTALSKDVPGGCFVRPSTPGQRGSLFRVALRRYEEFASDTGWNFFFTAVPIDIPIFDIVETADNEELRSYHLLNVCWYTRRRLIDQLYIRAKTFEFSETVVSQQKDTLVAEIKDDITSINIQSFIRKIDHPRTLEGILSLGEIRDDQKTWISCTSIIDRYENGSDESFSSVIKALETMDVMNKKYYVASAVAFSASAAARYTKDE